MSDVTDQANSIGVPNLAESSNLADQSDTSAQPPTRARYWVLVLLCTLAGVLYMDRVCIASALNSIQKDLKLDNTQTAIVLMAFTLAYGLFEVPTGYWGDRLGARRVLTRISVWWSIFTALTGLAFGFYSLITIRFLFGAGEAGAYPNAARVMAKWFPEHERGRAQGFMLAASQIGGAITPALATALIVSIGWRLTFFVFGAVGCVWAAVFYWWFRDEPSEHPKVNAAEVRLIGQGSAGKVHSEEKLRWSEVLTNPSVLFLSTIMTCASFNSYIYFSWFQKYLQSGRGVPQEETGWMTSLVLAGAGVGTFLGGYLMDRIVRQGGIGRRRLTGAIAFFSAAIMLQCGLWSEDPWLASLFAGISCLFTQATQPLWWSCTIGVSGRHIGALFGLMNSAGVVGAMTSQGLTGWLADLLKEQGYSGRAQWDPIFQINLLVLITAAILWSTFRFKVVSSEP